MPNHSWESPRAKRAHMAATQEEENQPMHNATSAIRGKLLSTNQTQALGSMGPHAAAIPTYQKQYHVLKTKGSTCQPLDESWRRLVAGPGRPTSLVGRWPSGPHRLKLRRGASSLVDNVSSGRISCSTATQGPWLPPIYMRGGGKEWDTLTHHTIHSSLQFSLE